MKEYESKGQLQANKGFYQEIDSLRLKSSCSLLSIIVVLVVIFLVIIGLLFLNRNKKITLSFNGLAPKINIPSLSEQQIERQYTVTTKDNKTVIILTEKEANDLIGVNQANFPLKNATLQIFSDKLLVSGKVSNSLLGVKVDCSLMPEVKDNRIAFRVTDVRSGKIAAPKAVVDQVKSKFDVTVSVPSEYKIELEQVVLHQGYVELIGRPLD